MPFRARTATHSSSNVFVSMILSLPAQSCAPTLSVLWCVASDVPSRQMRMAMVRHAGRGCLFGVRVFFCASVCVVRRGAAPMRGCPNRENARPSRIRTHARL